MPMQNIEGRQLEWVKEQYPPEYLPAEALLAQRPPAPNVPAEIVDEAERQFSGLECADNFRAFRASDWYGYEHFMHRELRGCCGVAHGVAFDYEGERWYFACNYGH